MKHLILLIGTVFALPGYAHGQTRMRIDTSGPIGAWARMEISLGDTVFVMSLRPVRVASKRQFKDQAEMRQYYLYARAAKKVYPYAVQALEVYDEWQEETGSLKKRKQRKYAKEELKTLNDQFEAKLKKLTKTEGKVLIKMIERETGKPFHQILKETRGGATATYWTNLSRMWGYDLKEGYQLGANPLLDDVFVDYDFGRPIRE